MKNAQFSFVPRDVWPGLFIYFFTALIFASTRRDKIFELNRHHHVVVAARDLCCTIVKLKSSGGSTPTR